MAFAALGTWLREQTAPRSPDGKIIPVGEATVRPENKPTTARATAGEAQNRDYGYGSEPAMTVHIGEGRANHGNTVIPKPKPKAEPYRPTRVMNQSSPLKKMMNGAIPTVQGSAVRAAHSETHL